MSGAVKVKVYGRGSNVAWVVAEGEGRVGLCCLSSEDPAVLELVMQALGLG